ncbi:MAG: 30S ribosome-binding factor RbfA [Chloroflexia bacterium]|nr:30S ribosome-binding factor RbfA [Chloroflexia bacterium]
MSSRRSIQLARLIQQELSELLQRTLKDPRLGFVTLTEVRLSPDLRNAQVFFSVLGEEKSVQDSLAALQSATGFLRRELGHRLTMRYIPQLEFVLDRSVERSQRIFDLLRQVREQEPSGEE